MLIEIHRFKIDQSFSSSWPLKLRSRELYNIEIQNCRRAFQNLVCMYLFQLFTNYKKINESSVMIWSFFLFSKLELAITGQMAKKFYCITLSFIKKILLHNEQNAKKCYCITCHILHNAFINSLKCTENLNLRMKLPGCEDV